jgi:hypothetical protein
MHFFFCFIQAYLQLIGKKQKMLGQSLSFVYAYNSGDKIEKELLFNTVANSKRWGGF